MANITIADIAKMGNVSKATVSRVLNHPDTVSEEQKSKILRIIAETGYVPNQFARRLGRSETAWGTALFVYDIINPYFGLMIRGLTGLAMNNHMPMFVFETLNDTKREELYLETLFRNKVSGVILTAGVSEGIVAKVSSKFPLVIIDQHCPHLHIPEVASDNVTGAKHAVEYLIRLNHKRIGFIAGPASWVSVKDRFEGYRTAMQDAGLEVRPEYIFHGDLQVQSGREALRYFTSLKEWPTAIFSANDQMAVGFMNQAQSMNIKIPEDFSLVGFDGTSEGQQMRPRLTTVQQDVGVICNTAFDLLLKSIGGEDVARRYLIDTRLIIGDTCHRIIE